MDWLKLCALLVAVASVQITAEGLKKKIRIHLPQKVKHIHHHKKIYITNHPASSQYAPAYMPSAQGAVAVPTNVALPAVASIVPFNTVNLYEESQTRQPSMSSASSKLLPLYRARGYYGPQPSDWEEQKYDLAPPPEPTDKLYMPTAFSSGAAATSSNYQLKRAKLVKVNETPRKKVVRKTKPKRVLVRGQPLQEEEHPVSTFHEQFYSDLDGSGTLRKIKKPQRVEKIIDGDTEHIHTYSEEHIHKLMYDDESGKMSSLVGVDPVGSMSVLSATPSLIPFKNSQALLAFSPDTLTDFTAIGSMGTPSHLEYAAYNPREVTHDHIFHDHGEIPPDMDIIRDPLSVPPRVSYNSQGLRIGGNPRGLKSKYNKYPKTKKATPVMDFTYYESMYNPYNIHKNIQKSVVPVPQYETSPEASIEDYRPVSSFKFKNNMKAKQRNVIPAPYYGNGKQTPDYRQHTSVPAPFSVSSTVVHDYKPKTYAGHTSGPTGLTQYKDPLVNFKDNSYSSNFDYDTYASSSNFYATEDKLYDSPALTYQGNKGKTKSISTQNINFGGLDHQEVIDNFENSGISEMTINDPSPTALEHYNNYDQPKLPEVATSTPFTIRESSPLHTYYSSMAIKALHGDQPSAAESSNDNYQYAEVPTPTTTPYAPSVATTSLSPNFYLIQSTDPVPTEPTDYISKAMQRRKLKDHKSKKRYPVLDMVSSVKEFKGAEKSVPTHSVVQQNSKHLFKHIVESPSATASLKYGDKI